LNQDLQQFIGVRFDGLTNLDKFHDVDTPFAAFEIGLLSAVRRIDLTYDSQMALLAESSPPWCTRDLT
jgi:hypothetical protein